MPEKHALLSASSAYRWTQCPPSAWINAIFPEETSKAAEEGRKLHNLAELILNGKTSNQVNKYVKSYTDFVNLLHVEYSKSELTKLYVEHLIDFSNIAPDGFGTADATLINKSILHIFDFKSGSEPVVAINNKQLALYLAGAINTFGFSGKSLRATIVQPKVYKEPQTWVLSVTQLNQLLENIKTVARTSYEGKGDFKAGDHCIFCKFKEKCPEHKKYFNKVYEF